MDDIYYEYIDNVQKNEFLSGNDFSVFYYICRKSMGLSYKSKFRIDQKKISKETGISRPTIRRCIDTLQQEGYIKKHNVEKGRGNLTSVTLPISIQINSYYRGELSIKQLRKNTKSKLRKYSGYENLVLDSADKKWKNLTILGQNDRIKWKEFLQVDKNDIKNQFANFCIKWKNLIPFLSKMENFDHFNGLKWKISFHFISQRKPMGIKKLMGEYRDYIKHLRSFFKQSPPIYSIYYIRILCIIDYYIFEQNLIPLILNEASKEKDGKKIKGFRITEENKNILPDRLRKIDGFSHKYNRWLHIQENKHDREVTKESRQEELERIAEFSSPLEALSKAIVGEWKNIYDNKKDENKNYNNNSDEHSVNNIIDI